MIRWVLAMLAGWGTVTEALAQTTVSLGSAANANSVFVDFFSDAFGRINLTPESFHQLSNSSLPNNPRLTVPVTQFGSFNMFPNNANFTLGMLTHVTGTGVGTETLNVTGLALNVAQDIDISLAYTTTVGALTGTATRVNGTLTSLDVSASVMFTITEAPFAGLQYPGTFALSGNQFDLFVDATATSGFGPVPLRWDADGTVNAVTPIPEPLSGLWLVAGGVGGWCWYRRGHKLAPAG
jgi:hypothetical protein